MMLGMAANNSTAVPTVLRSQAAGGPAAGPGLAEHFEHRIRPISAGVAVPVFAFFAAGVTVGAHVGYRDLAGFGRRFLDCSPTELADDVLYQIGALEALAGAAGATVRYVKPHGALYNTIVHHEEHAQAVIDGIAAFGADLPVLLLPGSVALKKAEAAGLRGVAEAFADRGYTPEGTLVSRRDPGAVLHDETEVAARMVRLATEGVLTAVDGSDIRVEAASICVHGDTPGSVSMAAAVRSALEDAGVEVASFA